MHGLEFYLMEVLHSKFLGWFGLGDTKLLYTEGAVLLGMVYNFIPFMILQVNASLSKMDTSLLEASSDLGANRFSDIFGEFTFPLSFARSHQWDYTGISSCR